MHWRWRRNERYRKFSLRIRKHHRIPIDITVKRQTSSRQTYQIFTQETFEHGVVVSCAVVVQAVVVIFSTRVLHTIAFVVAGALGLSIRAVAIPQ